MRVKFPIMRQREFRVHYPCHTGVEFIKNFQHVCIRISSFIANENIILFVSDSRRNGLSGSIDSSWRLLKEINVSIRSKFPVRVEGRQEYSGLRYEAFNIVDSLMTSAILPSLAFRNLKWHWNHEIHCWGWGKLKSGTKILYISTDEMGRIGFIFYTSI